MTLHFPRRVAVGLIGFLSAVTFLPTFATAQTFIFNGSNSDVVTHVKGYTGSGGHINITVGVDPTSLHASDMEVSVQNVVRTWNRLEATTGNIQLGAISGSSIDFESVLLHEMGHSLGLGHINLASESGLSGSDLNYSASTRGANGNLDLNAGSDGVKGSSDDIRGDDVNLNYFEIGVNNPFVLNSSGVFDSTTYSRDVADLPAGHNFAANADRDVAALLGFANTEGVMQQGSFGGEFQRSLAASDVVGIRYAMSGVDEIQGTADDYTYTLQYVGQDAGADIVIDFDDSETGFAVSQSSGIGVGTDHFAINNTAIFFNSGSGSGFNWHFNSVLAVPEPTSLGILGALAVGAFVIRRRKA